MIKPVRVRMAPSPTGHLHLGGLRTAYFNWLFARHNNGTFLLRIEDTDLERSKSEYTASILESFDWVGIASDEPIVIQSQRLDRHKEVIEKMLQEGTAYRCYCTPEELQERLGAGAAQEGSYTRYDRKCCVNSIQLKTNNKPYTIRFKLPSDIEKIEFEDLIRGTISFPIDQFDDFIIARSDGSPMYNFVVVVDDADMGITHIIRGEDHIANTPKQILLYKACGFPIPYFAHVSMILGPGGNKLSKRDAATSVIDYRKNGYLANALCNYLVRLGWSHGDQEIFTTEELIKLFSLDHVGKKGAIFDVKKLEWLNGLYMRRESPARLLELIDRDIDPTFIRSITWSEDTVFKAIDLYKERAKTLVELVAGVKSLFAPGEIDPQELAPWKTKEVVEHLSYVSKVLSKEETFTIERLQEIIHSICTDLGVSLAQIGKPLRIALTGKISSPGIYQLLDILGKDESRARINHFVEHIQQ